jgi:hypothetical protein
MGEHVAGNLTNLLAALDASASDELMYKRVIHS